MKLGPKTWLIAQAKSTAGVGPIRWLKLVSLQGPDALPIFSTEENARSYIQATGEERTATLAEMSNLNELINVLEDLAEKGIAERFVLDPKQKTGVMKPHPIKDFIDFLRKQKP